MSRHRYPGWKSGLREGCQLISHLPSHTGAKHHNDAGGGGCGAESDGSVYNVVDVVDYVYDSDDDVDDIDDLQKHLAGLSKAQHVSSLSFIRWQNIIIVNNIIIIIIMKCRHYHHHNFFISCFKKIL